MKNKMRKLSRMVRKFIISLSIVLLFAISFNSVLAQNSAQVGVFADHQLAPGARVEVPIEIRGVQDLYAIDIELSFDPAILSAEDADPSMDGIQPALGTFLDAGLLLYNSIDLETGIIRFAMSQVNPSEPKSGNGILLVVYFIGKTAGESNLTVNSLTLSDRLGMEIPSSGVNSSITVVTDAPLVTNTSIPIQDPTGMIIVPTLAPTSTPTQTPLPTKTPAPTQTVVPAAVMEPTAVEPQPTDMAENLPDVSGEVENKGGFSLSQNWWIILVAGLILAAAVGYQQLTKRRQAAKDEDQDLNSQQGNKQE